MKKLIYLLIASLAVVSCQKDPDLDELSNEYVVYTSYDASQFATPYAAGTKVFVADSITVLNADGTVTGWYPLDPMANSIIAAYKKGLTDYGYAIAETKAGADLQLTMAYVQNITLYYDYYPDYWWWDWWDYPYWPSWYYPYPYDYFVYAYSSISMTAELLPANALPTSNTLPIKWNSFLGGYDFGSRDANGQYILDRIPQAFSQSPYLQTN